MYKKLLLIIYFALVCGACTLSFEPDVPPIEKGIIGVMTGTTGERFALSMYRSTT